MTKEKWVYKFKMVYYGPEFGPAATHKHSGFVIAYDLRDAFNKLYNAYHEIYVNSLDEGEEDKFDIDTINITEYGDIMDDIIADEEDDYYGI